MEALVHGMLSNAAAVALLAVPIVILARLARRPALVHAVCLLALLKLVTPPILPVPIARLEPAPAARASAEPEPREVEATDAEFLSNLTPEDLEPLPAMAASRDETLTVAQPPAEVRTWRWERPALLLILAGATAWWGLALVRIARFHRALGDARPMPANGQAEVEAAAARIGPRPAPRAFLVPGGVPPMIWAVGWPARLLVPARLWNSLDREERSTLLLHELAHLKRRDHWIRWAELAIAGLYWWNPALWWLRRALREAEEQCCDAWVVWAMPGGGERTYASALVLALEFVSGSRKAPMPAAAATLGNGHVSSMKRRLRMIVKARTSRRLSWPGKLAVACLSALLLPLGPTWAQKAGGDDGAAKPRKPEPPAAAPGDGAHDRLSARLAEELRENDMRLLDAFVALENTKAQLVRAKELKNATGERRSRLEDRRREERIAEAFKKEPEARELVERFKDARRTLAESVRKARQPDDPSIVAASNHLRSLNQQWRDLWERKHDEIAATLKHEADDLSPGALADRVRELETSVTELQRKRDRLTDSLQDPATARRRSRDDVHLRAQAKPSQRDEGREDAQDGDTASRLEARLKELKDKLARDLDPLSDAIRKELDRTLENFQQALEKEKMTTEDLRRAMEKSRRDLRESLGQGGPLEKSIRDAAERARRDLREMMERSLEDARRRSDEALDPFRAHRDEQAKHTAELAERHRRRIEEQRKAIEERRDRRLRDVERLREQMHEAQQRRKEARKQEEDQARERDEQKPGGKPPTTDSTNKAERPDSNRAELDAARKEIRELRQRLLEANRQLRQLQHPDREPRRPRSSDRPAAPAPPDRPAAAARPAESSPSRDDLERRFRELDDKMNRLLKELDSLKHRGEPNSRH